VVAYRAGTPAHPWLVYVAAAVCAELEDPVAAIARLVRRAPTIPAMRIVREGARSETYGGRFTGAVELEMLDEAPSGDRPDTALVRFRDGATTNWHAHPGGQLLWVVGGDARVGNEPDGESLLGPGTLVVIPVDERHWHGAAPGSDCTFLAVTWGTTAWEDRPAP
jgi:quercetin dioxygenase-like cupin family protein